MCFLGVYIYHIRFLLQVFSAMFVFKEKKTIGKFGGLYKKSYLCIALKNRGV